MRTLNAVNRTKRAGKHAEKFFTRGQRKGVHQEPCLCEMENKCFFSARNVSLDGICH